MKVKIKDIAKAAGVSPTAVSQVLNDRPCRLAEATKEKILRVAREMKFQDQELIAADRFGNIKTVGLIISEPIPFFLDLSYKITQELYKKGYTVFQCTVGNDLDCCYKALESLTCKNVDGIIVIPPCTGKKDTKLPKMLKALQNSGVPMILVDRAVYSVFCDFVTTDNKLGGKIATESLIHCGHRKIGCIMGKKDAYTVRKRIDGYKQALVSCDISYDEKLVYYGEFTRKTGEMGAEDLISKGVTAIFAGNDEIAVGIYEYAKKEKIRIPEELSVIGFDNTSICDFLTPPLSSVEQNTEQLAEKIVEVMLSDLEKTEEEDAPSNYYYTPVLKERASVGKMIL